MRVRITNAFATRWHEEWYLAGKQVGLGSYGTYPRRIELFLEQFGPELARVLKPQLLNELLREMAEREAVEKTKLDLDTVPPAA